ncbi:MAG: CotH kinase family protein [Bacteroidaceae bacterium]|nr:CotH kinase family protein [Bacteroidaceae bacterium]
MTKKIPALWIMAVLMCMPLTAIADAYNARNYLPTNTKVKLTETNLPIVFINTMALNGKTTVIHKDYRVPVRMTIIDNDDGKNYGDTLVHPGQTVNYDGWVGIKYRGTSSFHYSKKKPMGFKTLKTSDVEGKKQKVELLGMPKDNDWVLMAPYHDRSMIRDVLTFELARPYFEFTPHARHCELIMDDVYRGVYILCERPRKGKYRLNLEDPGEEGDSITGDYMVVLDGHIERQKHYYKSKYRARDENGNNIVIRGDIYFQYKFPEYEDMMPDHPAQLDYIDQRISDFEDALIGNNFKDPETGYRKYIDVTSFIDFMLSQEFSGNPDAYRRSTYLYKRRDDVDPRFKMCLWDFNMAYGNSLDELLGIGRWHYINNSSTQMLREAHVPFWWERLMEDEYYVNGLKTRWDEYRRSGYREEHITSVIDSLVNLLESGGARERNYKAWPNWNEYIFLDLNETKNYEEEIAFLRQWITNRLTWLDQQLEFDAEDGLDEIYNGWQTTDNSQRTTVNKGNAVYDLSGRKIDFSFKSGIYLLGGRKVLVR